MYLVAWVNLHENRHWVWVSGEDEMNVFVSDLVRDGVSEDDIHVFDSEDEIR